MADSPRPSRETILSLLNNAQEYLGSLLEQTAPDSILFQAWDEFYRVYDRLIRRFVVAQGVPYAEIDDCVQEVWCEVVTRLVDFKRPADRPGLRAWLYTLVRAKTAGLFRRKYRQKTESLEQGGKSSLVDNDQTDPATFLERRWERALLESMIAELREELSDVNYRILVLRLIEDRDVSEVATELSLTPEQVRYRYHRVMRKLRVRLTVFTGEPAGPPTD